MIDAEVYRYVLSARVAAGDLEDTLALAVLACQALHGEAQVRLDAGYEFDGRKRTCAIDASTPVGRDLNRLFTGLLAREFGAGAFQVTRGARARKPSPTAA